MSERPHNDRRTWMCVFDAIYMQVMMALSSEILINSKTRKWCLTHTHAHTCAHARNHILITALVPFNLSISSSLFLDFQNASLPLFSLSHLPSVCLIGVNTQIRLLGTPCCDTGSFCPPLPWHPLIARVKCSPADLVMSSSWWPLV